ncbi:pol protein [Cucumis melo var. makuwa]|uniref:Pol protein n=1 Tax=Cucumis melo var. makuwa TaxID=1194695 RepID=A0A5A7U1K4_CUCMM|nr:pol protein [Cucumis melo var. makuwa]TYJ98669.1 pol protein [Cucumis melo var. makuwa]
MTPFEALYGRCCRSPVCWGEVGEQRMLGHELVQTTNVAIQKTRARMLTAQSRQKSYVDERRKDLKFDVRDMVFLKPNEGCSEVREEGEAKSTFLHDVFHVSMLRKYVADPTHVVDFEPLRINENLSYEEQLVEILAKEVKMLRNRGIALVKVFWRNHGVEEATWEREDDMRAQYPELSAAAIDSHLLAGHCPLPQAATTVVQSLRATSVSRAVCVNPSAIIHPNCRAPSSESCRRSSAAVFSRFPSSAIDPCNPSRFAFNPTRVSPPVPTTRVDPSRTQPQPSHPCACGGRGKGKGKLAIDKK